MDKKMAQDIERTAEAFSHPIDFDQLVEDGLLIQKGKSFYASDIHALPESVAQRIKQVTPTRNGTKVTFYKELTAAKKFVNQRNSDTK